MEPTQSGGKVSSAACTLATALASASLAGATVLSGGAASVPTGSAGLAVVVVASATGIDSGDELEDDDSLLHAARRQAAANATPLSGLRADTGTPFGTGRRER